MLALTDIYLAETERSLLDSDPCTLNRRSLSQVSTPHVEKVNVETNVNLRFTFLLFSIAARVAIYRNSETVCDRTPNRACN